MRDADDQLLNKAVTGDTDALIQLLRRHGQSVQEQLRIGPQWQSMVGPEDVMQITYFEAFMHIGRFDAKDGSTFAGWLRQIAENNLRDAIRGLARQKAPHPANRVYPAASGDSFVGLLEMLGATSATPSRAAALNESRTLLESAIARLPADYATVVQLYDLEGNSIADVAVAMKRSAGAVHMLRARAHDSLRELLGRESIFFSNPA
jgi:RNA polymerase sigma-70 factor (ECF subfamily)